MSFHMRELLYPHPISIIIHPQFNNIETVERDNMQKYRCTVIICVPGTASAGIRYLISGFASLVGFNH